MNEISKKKLGRPKMLTHRDPNFGVSMRNDHPVILERDPSWPVFTDERFQYLISKQPEWRSQFLKEKKSLTNYSLNKEYFRNYYKTYNAEKKLDKEYEKFQISFQHDGIN